MYYTHIRWSGQTRYFQEQWSHHLALQQAGSFTDLTLQCRDGCISLHQSVLLPLSSLLLYSITWSMADIPLVLVMPDYDLTTAQSLVSLLYTGSCTHQSSGSYYSLLSMLSCVGINLSPTSLTLCSTEQEDIKKSNINAVKPSAAKSSNVEWSSSRSDDMATGVEGIESLCLGQSSHPDSILPSSVIEESNIRGINGQNKKIKFNLRFRDKVLNGNVSPSTGLKRDRCCQVCGVQIPGGMSKLRAHLVEKHFYKELSAKVSAGTKKCPECEKIIDVRCNLVKHLGIVHRHVDQLLKSDINQNSPNTANDNDNIEVKKVNIEDNDNEDIDKEPEQTSPSGLFKCSLCNCRRKSEFRLLQHYSAAHFRDQLEEHFGIQFVTSNGSCPVCRKIMKNLHCFLIHIGAIHGEVKQFIENEEKTNEELSESPLLDTWSCPNQSCKNEFPNKSLLMKHFSTNHYHYELSSALQPLFEESKSCKECGKTFTTLQRYLLHCSVTHRMVLPYCSQAEVDSLRGEGSGGKSRPKRVEGGEKTIKCTLCDSVFSNKYLLRKHYTAKHFYDALSVKFAASVSSGVCELCGQKHTGTWMVQHLGVTHGQVEPFIGHLTNDEDTAVLLEPEVILTHE